MSEDTTFPVYEPSAELRKLERLVGTWKLSDEARPERGDQVGSPAYCRSEFSEDGNTMTAEWVYPGGGYQTTGTRIAE